MKTWLAIAFLACLAVVLPTAQAQYKVVCYYGSWAVYRPGPGKFDVEQIDPTLCTHLIYTFVGLGEGGKVNVLDSWNDLEDNYGKGAFKRFVKLKQRNPAAKTLVAIGGWNEGSTKYSAMVANDQVRATFVKNVVAFVKKYGFDGFDLDWEYPNQRGGVPGDVANYVKLVRDLRLAFDKEGLLLTAAVAAAEFSMSLSYDVPQVSKYLDHIHVMAYDLHGIWDGKTGQNAPLYASKEHDISDTEKQLNVEACIDIWIKKGADPKKIILGMGTYGHSFTLQDTSNTGLGSKTNTPGAAGPYTRQAGMLGYNEIVEYQKQGGWTVVWDDEQKVPYMYKGNQWVGYDDPKSIALKIEFAKSKGLGGGMIWSIETDDFNGVTGEHFPLLRAINNAFGNVIPTEPPTTEGPSTTSTTTEISTTTRDPTAPTTTPDPNDPASYCTGPGYVRDPKNCAVFYYCVATAEGWKTFRFECADGLYFNPATNNCDYTWNVKCDVKLF